MWQVMKHNFHGLFSLLLISFVLLISLIILFDYSLFLGALYLIICLLSFAIILRLFCAKCPNRNFCGHKLPGLLAAKLFPNIFPNPYNRAEWFLLALLIILIIGFPQYWLFNNNGLFLTTWLMLITAGIEIKLRVCTNCKNVYCPYNKSFKGF